MLHTKYESTRPSSFREKELLNFLSLFPCSTCAPQSGASLTPGASYEQRGRVPQGDVTYQISSLYAFQFQIRRILKMDFFVAGFQLLTPGAGPVLTPGASYEQTWYRSTKKCYIQNIKALRLPVSEKKNYANFVLFSYVQLVTPTAGQF